MRRSGLTVIVSITCVLLWTGAANGQGRGPTEWMTSHADAQRSSWIRTDAKISTKTLEKPGFQLLWKIKMKNDSRQSGWLTQPVLLDLLIGYRGFRALGFVGDSSDNIFVLDTDLGRMEWQKRLSTGGARADRSPGCAGGMAVNVTRPTIYAITPPPVPTGSFGGRQTPARGAVGNTGEGAVTLAQVRPAPPAPAPTPAPASSTPSRPSTPKRPAPAMPSLFGSGPFLIYALSSDGRLHI